MSVFQDSRGFSVESHLEKKKKKKRQKPLHKRQSYEDHESTSQ